MRLLTICVGLAGLVAATGAASATTYYNHHRYHHPIARMAYVVPPRYAAVPCQYPTGWNLSDFVRDVNGRPEGINHTCVQRTR